MDPLGPPGALSYPLGPPRTPSEPLGTPRNPSDPLGTPSAQGEAPSLYASYYEAAAAVVRQHAGDVVLCG